MTRMCVFRFYFSVPLDLFSSYLSGAVQHICGAVKQSRVGNDEEEEEDDEDRRRMLLNLRQL